MLRELEQKKPQLDDLVKTAENLRESPIRQQIPEKGKTKLDIILVSIVHSGPKYKKKAIQGRRIVFFKGKKSTLFDFLSNGVAPFKGRACGVKKKIQKC